MNLLKKIERKVDLLCRYIMIALFTAMTAVALLQIICRFILGNPLTWTDEFCCYAMVWITMFGCGIAVKRKSHIAIDILKGAVPKQFQLILEKLASLSALILCAILIWYGTTLSMLNMVQISAGLHWRLGLMYLAIPVGGAIMFFYALLSLLGLDREFDQQEG